ncbi:MAG: flippase [Nitrospirae bacterium]|nr:flippase [Nitrospirota bacterium]
MISKISLVYSRLDHHSKELVNGTAVTFSLKMLAAGLAFALNVTLARLLGADGSGIYFLALTVTTIGAVVGRIGLDNTMLRFAASNAAVNDWAAVKGVYTNGMRIALLSSGVVAGVMFIIASLLAHKVFSQPEISNLIRLMALSIVPVSLFTLHAEILKGIKRTGDAIAVLSVFAPAFSLAGVYLLVPGWGVKGAVWAYISASVITLFIGIYLWQRATPQLNGIVGGFDKSRMLETSMPMFSAALLQLVIQWTATILMGMWASSVDVGIFSVASRTAMLTSFILVAVNSIAAPKFAALYRQGDMEALSKTARNSTKLMILLASPVLFLFLVVPGWIMHIFGKGFTGGAAILSILAVGQFVNVATGSVGYLLMMSGNERLMRNNLAACAVINLLLNIALIPTFGVTGAAIATTATLSLQNLIAAKLVSWKLGIRTML